MSLYEDWSKEVEEKRKAQIQVSVDMLNAYFREEVAKRVEEVANFYQTILVEKDREVVGLRLAIEQSAKDFQTLLERTSATNP